MLATATSPGVFGIPVRPWVNGIECGGTTPLGLPADKSLNAPSNVATSHGVSAAGVSRQVAASPPQMPTTVMNLYVRKTGSDNNGGSSNGTGPDRTGTDGVTNATTTFTAATGSFTADDVNKLINIVTKGRYRIVAFTNSTTVTISGSPSAGSGLTWNLGGAVQTIGALLANTNAAVLGGDRIWIGAGVYRELVTIGPNPTFDIRVEGDVDGAMTGDSGIVKWTSYLTNDRTAPSGAGPLIGSIAKSNFTFVNLVLIGSNLNGQSGTIYDSNAGVTRNVNWIRCVFFRGGAAGSSQTLLRLQSYGNGILNINSTFDQCIFVGRSASQGGGLIALGNAIANGFSADYDLGLKFRNCLFLGPGNNAIRSSGSLMGGVQFLNCSFIGPVVLMQAGFSTSIPVRVQNCYMVIPGANALTATTFGQIVEDFNLIDGGRTNVTPGPHSISDGSYDFEFSVGQEVLYGMLTRPFSEPTLGSPALGFINTSLVEDMLGRPRSGSLTAVGALDRGNTWGKETGTVRTGLNALSITGPGYEDYDLPVDPVPMAVTIYMRYDSTYAGPRPQIHVVNGTECGVFRGVGAFGVGDSDFDPGPNVWGKIVLPFTPTAKGFVTIRLLSSDTSGAGKAFADDMLAANV